MAVAEEQGVEGRKGPWRAVVAHAEPYVVILDAQQALESAAHEPPSGHGLHVLAQQSGNFPG